MKTIFVRANVRWESLTVCSRMAIALAAAMPLVVLLKTGHTPEGLFGIGMIIAFRLAWLRNWVVTYTEANEISEKPMARIRIREN